MEFPATLRTYTVSLINRYGVDKEYIAHHNITLDATSDAEACKLALLRFPASWHMEVNSAKRHENAAW
jgi:hypothetical protein